MGVDFSKEGHIAKVALNVVKAKNALSSAMLMDLCNIWDECSKNDSIRVEVLCSALPDIFCAGMTSIHRKQYLINQHQLNNR